MIRFLKRYSSHFLRSDSGNGTIEFLILLPLTLAITFSSFESGMLTTRQMLLEHSLNKVTRSIRIGNIANVTHSTIKDAVCNSAFLINNCKTSLKVEMIERELEDFKALSPQITCLDKAETAQPVQVPDFTQKHKTMFLKVCATFDPVLPTSGLGFLMNNNGKSSTYALSAVSAYAVVSP